MQPYLSLQDLVDKPVPPEDYSVLGVSDRLSAFRQEVAESAGRLFKVDEARLASYGMS